MNEMISRNQADQPPSTRVSPAASATEQLPRVEPGFFLGVLRRRWWIAAITTTAAVVAMAGYLTKVPKTYLSTGAVYVSTEAPQILDIRALAPAESRDLEQMQSVEHGMVSTTLLLRVIRANGLDVGDAYAGEELSEQELLGLLSKRVRVGLERGTRIIRISVEDTDPGRARQLVESIKQEYENLALERQERLTEQVSEGLAREEKRLREQMEASARRVQDFREANPVPGLEGVRGDTLVRDELGTLAAQLGAASAERLRLEAEFEAFGKFDPEDPDALAGLGRSDHSEEVLTLARQLRDKELEFAAVEKRYLHKHPVHIEISQELVRLRESLDAAVRTAGEALEKSYAVAVDNEKKLKLAMAEARDNAVDVEGLRADFNTLVREAEADRELHASVARRLRETSLAASVPASILRWEENPLVPERAFRPRKAILLPVAAFGGGFLGLILMAGAEIGDRRLRDPSAVARVLGAPLFASVPRARKAAAGRMLLTEDPASDTAEAFRRLRAVLAPPSGSSGHRTVLFTSARSGEGKSFCAMNHAASLALQGYRTLLVDGDLRVPGLSRDHLGRGDDSVGLGDFLAGRATPAEACFPTAVSKLFLLSSGEVTGEASELLAGTRFPALLEDAFRWFDRVVIDAPAVLETSDVQAIGRYADLTCLVVSEHGADKRELDRVVGLLGSAGARLSGFVWNDAPADPPPGSGPVVSFVRPAIAMTRPEPDEQVVHFPLPMKDRA